MKKLLLSMLILSLISVSNTTYPMAARIGQKVAQNAAKNPNSILGKAMQTVMKKAGLSPETKNTIQPLQPLVAVKPQAKSVNYKNSTITDAEKITQQVKSVAATEKQLLTKLDKKSNIKPLIKSFNKTAFKKNIVRPTVGKLSAIAANSIVISSAVQQETNASKNAVISDPLNNHRRLFILPDSIGADACLSNGSRDALLDFIIDGTTPFLVHKNCVRANAKMLNHSESHPFDMYEVSDSYVLLIPQAYSNVTGKNNLGFDVNQLRQVTPNQYYSLSPCTSAAIDLIVPAITGNKEHKLGQDFIETIEKLFDTANAKKYKWDFIIAGHSYPQFFKYTCGISETAFKQFLAFADEKINTNSLAYNTCWSGGSRLIDLFKRTYNYPIMCVGGHDGYTSSTFGFYLTKSYGSSQDSFQGYWNEISKVDTLNEETLKKVLYKRFQEYPPETVNRTFIREANTDYFKAINFSAEKPFGAIASQSDAEEHFLPNNKEDSTFKPTGILFIDTPSINYDVMADHIRSMGKNNEYFIKHVVQQKVAGSLNEKISSIITQFDFEEGFGAIIDTKSFYIDKITFKDSSDDFSEITDVKVTLKSNGYNSGDYTIIYRNKDGSYSKATASKVTRIAKITEQVDFNLEVLNPTESKKYEAEYLHNKQKISPEL